MSRKKEWKDHLGNAFPNLEAMCRHYGIAVSYYYRYKDAMPLSEILECKKPYNNAEECEDHMGQKFASIADMCRHWGLNRTSFNSRKRKGMTLEQILTLPTNKKVTDHKGNEFRSILEMCRHWGISAGTYQDRINRGWSMKDALEKENTRTCRDHKGNKFPSMVEMCKYWNVPIGTFLDRRTRKKWSIEKSLTAPGNKKLTDHLGQEFESQEQMLRHWGISKSKMEHHLSKGYTIEQILTGNVPHNGKEITDHHGTTFPSKTKIMERYGFEYCDLTETGPDTFILAVKKRYKPGNKIGNATIKKPLTFPYFLVSIENQERIMDIDEIADNMRKNILQKKEA